MNLTKLNKYPLTLFFTGNFNIIIFGVFWLHILNYNTYIYTKCEYLLRVALRETLRKNLTF